MTSFKPKLSAAEMLHLDGRCSPDAQTLVDQAKLILATRAELSDDIPVSVADYVAQVKSEATKSGKLRMRRRVKMRLCLAGGHKPEHPYIPYKSGPRKGRPNYDRPVYLYGFDLDPSFVHTTGYPKFGCCNDCVDSVWPVLREQLKDVRAELPDALVVEGNKRWKRYDNRRCSGCGWEGHDGQMRLASTLMGDGRYPSGCPNCSFENRPLGREVVEFVEGFTLIAVDEVAS